VNSLASKYSDSRGDIGEKI